MDTTGKDGNESGSIPPPPSSTSIEISSSSEKIKSPPTTTEAKDSISIPSLMSENTNNDTGVSERRPSGNALGLLSTKNSIIDDDGEESHTVTLTVNIAKAIPTAEDPTEDGDGVTKQRKRVLEAPKPQCYFHCSYFILPTDQEPVKTDVVTYPMAAKIYTEHDSKVLKTWKDGNHTWIAWSNTHTLKITKSTLLKLFHHTLELRIWDSKDKVSPRARFDRPKAFRLPAAKPGEDPDDVSGVRTLVLKQSKSFLSLQPSKSVSCRDFGSDNKRSDVLRLLPHEKVAMNKEMMDREPSPQGSEVNETTQSTAQKLAAIIAVPNNTTDNETIRANRSFSRLGRLAATEKPTNGDDNSVRPDDGPPPPTNRLEAAKKKKLKEGLEDGDIDVPTFHSTKQHGTCMIPVRMALLFAGMDSVTNRLDKSASTIQDVFVTVSVDGPLMSEKHREQLNPLVIKLDSVTDMPERPLSYEDLHDKCHPVRAIYKFFKEPLYTSQSKQHARNIYWDDYNVVLLGAFDVAELREYLNGPALQIELHDRDRKLDHVVKPPTLFGDDAEDDKISNVGMVTAKRTVLSAFDDRKPWDPYGLARFDLSGLLLGERILYLTSPVVNCSTPDVLDGGVSCNNTMNTVLGLPGAVDGPEAAPLPMGHYLDANTYMNLRVEIMYPLTTPELIYKKPILPTTESCPFSRIVCMFDYKNIFLLDIIISEVTKINSKALKLDRMPHHVLEAALSTYKLSDEQKLSKVLDIVTGFHVLDGEKHMFIIEGLKDYAIQTIWSSLPHKQNKVASDVEVLYDTDLAFSTRLYTELDVDLCRVRLHETLRDIVKQPLLYVRDMVPKPCFEALTKLDQLVKMKKLRDVARNDLFPTAEMIKSMSKEFGIPLTPEDFEEITLMEEKKNIDHKAIIRSFHTSRPWTPIDTDNIRYEQMLLDRQTSNITNNYIKDNVDDLERKSRAVARQRRAKTTPSLPIRSRQTSSIHNYSIQTLNTTEQAKEELRQSLKQEPDSRFSYCLEYNSGSITPVNVEASRKREKETNKARWRTGSGFIFPGFKSSAESNIHPRQPHLARQDELQLAWRENTLHSNQLKPTLPDREIMEWQKRNNDFNLWSRPHLYFNTTPPATIHKAGDLLDAEIRTAVKKESKSWEKKLVTDSTLMKYHRCGPGTELTKQGFKSSCQLDRLKGLLKDKPKKRGLCFEGAADIPALAVVCDPSLDPMTCDDPYYRQTPWKDSSCGFVPGPFSDNSLLLQKNLTPARAEISSQILRDKGYYFNPLHKEHKYLYSRKITDLVDKERQVYLFKQPPKLPDISYQREYNYSLYPSPTSSNQNITCELSNTAKDLPINAN